MFKAILGDPARVHLLLDFLHAVIEPPSPFLSVSIVNPTHLPDFLGDDFTVIDVQATDAEGRVFQIEMQSRNESALKPRILYTWADLYEVQLVSGDGYELLRPVISIWLLDENILRGAPSFHHRFTVFDGERGVELTRHLEIHTLELPKWRARREGALLPMVRWMEFFSGAESWTEVPEALQSPPLEEAMAVLNEFRTNAEWNHLYRARMDGLRRKKAQEWEMEQVRLEAEQARLEMEQTRLEMEQTRLEMEQARLEMEQARADLVLAVGEAKRLVAEKDQEKERALAAAGHLRARLRALGIDPDV